MEIGFTLDVTPALEAMASEPEETPAPASTRTAPSASSAPVQPKPTAPAVEDDPFLSFDEPEPKKEAQESKPQPPPATVVEPAPTPPAPAVEAKEEKKAPQVAEKPVVEPAPSAVSAPTEQDPFAELASEMKAPEPAEAPASKASADAVAAEPPSIETPERKSLDPVELPAMPSGEMEVASSSLELVNWPQGESTPEPEAQPASHWARRAIEVDFSEEAPGSSPAGSSPEDEVPLASVHEFIPTWEPSAEPAPTEASSSSTSESENTPLVQFEEALAALREATTRGSLGKALLSYCRGRFSRGFLLGDTFGLARVGQAYGPGSDKPAVNALRVDLEAPSLLATAAADGKPVVSSVPETQEDESLFSALGESFSHLVAAPIRLRERTVGFVVIDGGPSTFGDEELEELTKLVSAASEAYGRLHGASN